MQETMITLQGYLGNDPTLRRAGDSTVTNFRVASTPRRFNRSTGEWADAPTQWYTVNAWRGLAENVVASLHKSDPVVVCGRLIAKTWIKDNVEITSYEVEATMVGHDLTRGTTRFTKNPRPGEAFAPAAPAEDASPEMAA